MLKPASNMKSSPPRRPRAPEASTGSPWFHADAEPDAEGVIHGNLYVKGGPLGLPADWWQMKRHPAPVRASRKPVDDAPFDDIQRGLDGPRPIDNPYNAPVSALVLLQRRGCHCPPGAAGSPVFFSPFDGFSAS
jgi:hypothetical protein